ncbi:hypothetical protein H6G17_26120 [Chroococcidiopsis sp. FACHB-1243]|uniref:hypothetical protein n=1 Tax=Chroococcidiopsis sp. [FACHB-1243] TaxID=2692781 RepID=UPI001784F799|nr:hypothetical protein [Chroococcidiopsis sp. [FACHB-1243]]MBD2308948.1 hypothetical protein [Chroococcidiopsis sp. [FACHB-1243]]
MGEESRWQVPLLNENTAKFPVDVYLYCGSLHDRWLLITHYHLGNAILLARRAGSLNLFVFPQDVDPRTEKLE